MKSLIALLPGDGIGPEVAREGERVLQAVASRFNHTFELRSALIGGAAIDATGSPLPEETAALCREADAVLLGAVGGPKWSDPNAKVRPEQGLLALRREIGVFANLRPIQPHPALSPSSPIKDHLLTGVDIMFVRELTGGIYFGEKTRSETQASDLCVYTVGEIERIVRVACELARDRKRRVLSVDKANVLETSRLWRATTEALVESEYPDITLEHMLVDAAAMHLLKAPASLDVLVTENMFGDILTDEASMLAGSLGMLPSASLGADKKGLYEPIHGSAPDIAGKGIANPYAMILSTALLLRHSLGLETEAQAVERAVNQAIEERIFTADLATDGTAASMIEAADAVVRGLSG